MYQNEYYKLIYDIVNMGLVAIFVIGFIFVWLKYCQYELKALEIKGYQDLRLNETSLRIDKTNKEIALKYDLKIAKLQNKK